MISEFNSMEWFVANARKMSVVTVFLFLASLFAPLTALSAEEPNFYDGPGGYLQSPAARRDGADYRFNRLQNSAADKTNKVVGMALGAAVGGGLVVALGIASSPILAVATLVGSALAGGFVGDMFGGKAKSGVNRAAGSPDFMTWAGGLAGAAAGFMIPGGSVIGAAVGAGLGGMVGNYFANNKDSIADMPVPSWARLVPWLLFQIITIPWVPDVTAGFLCTAGTVAMVLLTWAFLLTLILTISRVCP
jgi:hypothetical protein